MERRTAASHQVARVCFLFFLLSSNVSLFSFTNWSETHLNTESGFRNHLQAQEPVEEKDQGSQLTIQDIVNRLELVLTEIGIRKEGGAYTYTTIAFYLSLAFLVLFVVIEIFVKIVKRVLNIPHREHPVKRVTRHFFVLTVIAKSLMFVIGALLILTHAQSASTFFRTYILNPRNLGDLFMRDRYFLIILGVLILYNFGLKALFGGSGE